AKAIHHVSTTGVFLSPSYRGRTISEHEPVRGPHGLSNGYAASKWVAETMMARARRRGFAVSVYRPAFVGWHTGTGHHGEHDLVVLLLRASLAAGCAPELDLQVNSVPVDQAAGIVAALVMLGGVATPSDRAPAYHIANRTAARFVDLAGL